MYHCWGTFLYTAFLRTHAQSGDGTFLVACASAPLEQRCQRQAPLLLHPKDEASSKPLCETSHWCKAPQIPPEHWAVTEAGPKCKEEFFRIQKNKTLPPPDLVPLKSPSKPFPCPPPPAPPTDARASNSSQTSSKARRQGGFAPQHNRCPQECPDPKLGVMA